MISSANTFLPSAPSPPNKARPEMSEVSGSSVAVRQVAATAVAASGWISSRLKGKKVVFLLAQNPLSVIIDTYILMHVVLLLGAVGLGEMNKYLGVSSATASSDEGGRHDDDQRIIE
jgi:hypothetical protein